MKHYTTKATKIQAMNTLVYRTSTNTKINNVYWEGGKFTKQINLDKESNCGFLRTIPSYQKIQQICGRFELSN